MYLQQFSNPEIYILLCCMTKQQLVEQIQSKKSYLCVGLDTDIQKIPKYLLNKPNPVLTFNKAIIDATRDFCVAFKINTAFFEAMGAKGWEIMAETFDYIGNDHLKIADAKRGDIGNTSHQYARAFFENLQADAVTVAPYMGEDSIRPFLEYDGKWTIVLGLTSNPGSNDFERLKLDGEDLTPLIPGIIRPHRGELLYERVLKTVSDWGNTNNLMFVIGATQASELGSIRSIIPDHFLLVPGVGAQGGSLAEVSEHGMNKETGLLVNASRAVIYASDVEDFVEAAAYQAKAYADEMAGYLNFV
jgi:orotidine-5'-phosphate decarboxylase